MSVAAQSLFAPDQTYVRDLEGLYLPWKAAAVPDPRILVRNDALAAELGLDAAALTPALLVGTEVPEGTTTVAQGYAGHQFGGYSPTLGDGRALLLGEIVDPEGRRFDLHLKGSGRTPFARGADGKAAVGPMLREYVIGEAMHALGIPTSRALAVTATGEDVVRETLLPGAVLARVAASHLRVGTFQYAAALEDPSVLQRLTDHAIARHHPQAAAAPTPALALLEAVIEVQAALVAQWTLVGFVHGVMNTDNMTISGETIDYGPCAFMEAFDPATVFSSIDQGGRYAYGNQPAIAQWNLARLAEALLPLIDDDTDQAVARATESLRSFPGRFGVHWRAGMREKLGLTDTEADDQPLMDELPALLQAEPTDYTSFFRTLATWIPDDAAVPPAYAEWVARWRARAPQRAVMDRVNPVYIPRNHQVEDALSAATVGDLAPFEHLVDVVTRPFEERPGLQAYAEPAPPEDGPYRTFCGT